MKKLLASFLVIAIVVSSICPVQSAEATTSTTESTQEDGINFYTNEHDYYYSDATQAAEVFTQFPATIEVTLKAGVHRPGTIIGNTKYPGNSKDSEGTFLLGLHRSRMPYLYIKDNDTTKTSGTMYYFGFTDNPSAERVEKENGQYTCKWNTLITNADWVHLTIVNDVANDKMYCYVNGGDSEGKPQVTLNGAYTGEWNSSTFLCLGGDCQERNLYGFKGYIKNVAVYSDVRTSEEITADVTAMKAEGVYTPSSDEAMMACYSLSTEVDASGTSIYPLTIKDLSANDLDLTTNYWMSEAQKEAESPRQDYDYSMVVVGDPQVVTYDSAKAKRDNANLEITDIDNLFNWIKDNAKSKKMEFIFNMGDTVNQSDVTDPDNSADHPVSSLQWEVGSSAVKSLDEIDVPYSIVRGNHDSIEMYNEHYAYADYKNKIAGSYDENMLNTYQKFQVDDIKYLVLNLDFGVGASYEYYEEDTENDLRMSDGSGNPDKVLAWANEVVKANPEYNVILTTHGYTYSNGTRLQNQTTTPTTKSTSSEGYWRQYNGEDIYEKLVKDNSNIVLVLSGHIGTEEIQKQTVTRDDGSKVVEMLVNPQYTDKWLGLSGMVAMLYFSNEGQTVQVEYYSTLRDRYYLAENQFTIDDLDVIKSTEIEGENGAVYLSSSQVNDTGTEPVPKVNTYQDYLFAGWYTNTTGAKGTAIHNKENVNEFSYAKFVPSDLLNVKVQVTNGIVTGQPEGSATEKYNGNYVMRFVSSVESLDYKSVGFEVLNKDGTRIEVVNSDGETVELEDSASTKVFQRIESTNNGSEYEFSPKVISKDSKYLMTAKLPVEPINSEDEEYKDYRVRAYWETYDGTKVYGESRCVSVSDNNGITDRANDVINITVNGELTGTDYTASFTSSPDNGETTYSKSALDVEILNTSDDGYTNVRIKLNKGDLANMASLTKVTIDGTAYYGMYRNYDTTHELADNDANSDGIADAYHSDTSWYYADTTADTFVIATSADLYGFAELVDGAIVFTDKTVIQVRDIQVNDGEAVKSSDNNGTPAWIPNKDENNADKLTYVWNPIGNSASSTSGTFQGTFDGDFNFVSGLYYNNSDSSDTNNVQVGLFSRVTGNAIVCNVRLTNSYISAGDNIGVIGVAAGKRFSNIYNDAIFVASGGFVGGIIGRLQGSSSTYLEFNVQNCWFNGEIFAGDSSDHIGGIVGRLQNYQTTLIQNCLNTGDIICSRSSATTDESKYSGIAGIVGGSYLKELSLSLENCIFNGNIRVGYDKYVASLAGWLKTASNKTINDCYVAGSVLNTTTSEKIDTVIVGTSTSDTEGYVKTSEEIEPLINSMTSTYFTWFCIGGEHSYHWVIDEDSKDDAVHQEVCTFCGKEKESVTHAWSTEVEELKEADYGVKGLKRYKCETCDVTKTVETDSLQPTYTNTTQYTMMSHNILRAGIKENNYEWSDILPTDRYSKLYNTYSTYKPDIIAFQECDEYWHDLIEGLENADSTSDRTGLEDLSALGYEDATAGKTSYSIRAIRNPIYYDTEKLEVVDAGYRTYAGYTNGAEESAVTPWCFTWAVFKSKGEGTADYFAVTSTHLIYNAGDNSYKRTNQVKELMNFKAELEDLWKVPVIMMGDYNTTIDSAPYTAFKVGTKVLSARDSATEKINMSYQTAHTFGQQPAQLAEGTTDGIIDHCMYSTTGVSADKYEVLVEEDIYSYSDHTPHRFTFKIKGLGN